MIMGKFSRSHVDIMILLFTVQYSFHKKWLCNKFRRHDFQPFTFHTVTAKLSNIVVKWSKGTDFTRTPSICQFTCTIIHACIHIALKEG